MSNKKVKYDDRVLGTRWRWIIQAKYNPNNPEYKWAHKLPLDWKHYDDFEEYILNTIGEPKGPNLFLNRINQKRGWVAGNLKWALPHEAANNRSNRWHLMVTYQGETLNLKQWASKLGIEYSCLYTRYKNGQRGKHLLRPARFRKKVILKKRKKK